MALDHSGDMSRTYYLLRIVYGLVPVLAGLDKFVGLLANWEAYLPAVAVDLLPMSPAAFMKVVGVIEVAAGLIVLMGLTRLGALIVMSWLVLIAVNLVIAGHLDIAVRDLVMAAGSFSLSEIAAWRGEQWIPGVTERIERHAHAS